MYRYVCACVYGHVYMYTLCVCVCVCVCGPCVFFHCKKPGSPKYRIYLFVQFYNIPNVILELLHYNL